MHTCNGDKLKATDWTPTSAIRVCVNSFPDADPECRLEEENGLVAQTTTEEKNQHMERGQALQARSSGLGGTRTPSVNVVCCGESLLVVLLTIASGR